MNQFFWAAPKGSTNLEVVEYNPISKLYFRPGYEAYYEEGDFDWIGEERIAPPENFKPNASNCANYEHDYDEIPQ